MLSASEFGHLQIMGSKIRLVNADDNPDFAEGVEDIIAKDSSLGQFYYSLTLDHPFKESDIRENNIGEYICLVFNKVPDSLMDGTVSYKLPKASTPLREQMFHELIPLDENGFPSNIIGYDSMLSEQFISSSIAVIGNGKKNWKERFSERFAFAHSQYEEEDKVRVVKSLGKSYSGLIKTLRKEGYKALSKAFNLQTSPTWSLMDLMSKTKSATNYVLFDKDILNENSINNIISRNYEYLDELIDRKGLSKYSAILHSLVDEIHNKTTAAKKQRMAPRYLANVSILLRMAFFVIDCEYKEEEEFYDFAVSEYLSKDSLKRKWKNYMPDDFLVLYGDILASNVGLEGLLKNVFGNFYRSFVYAFIKMHDAIDDYMLLLHAYQYTILSDSPRLINKYMKDYVARVVVNKGIRCDMSEFKQIAEKPMEMKIVQDLIKEKVLKQWS